MFCNCLGLPELLSLSTRPSFNQLSQSGTLPSPVPQLQNVLSDSTSSHVRVWTSCLLPLSPTHSWFTWQPNMLDNSTLRPLPPPPRPSRKEVGPSGTKCLFICRTSVLHCKLSGFLGKIRFPDLLETRGVSSLSPSGEAGFQALLNEGKLTVKMTLQAVVNAADTASQFLVISVALH